MEKERKGKERKKLKEKKKKRIKRKSNEMKGSKGEKENKKLLLYIPVYKPTSYIMQPLNFWHEFKPLQKKKLLVYSASDHRKYIIFKNFKNKITCVSYDAPILCVKKKLIIKSRTKH